ncbi:MAG: FHA domain-containing protein [Thermoguttaceae bacterium]
MDCHAAQPTDKFMLWVDAVGGFLVCGANEVTLGQPVRCSSVDIPILGDISSRHASIRRDGEGYVIEAMRDVWVDGRPVDRTALLGDGNDITLGRGVRLSFRRPHALSATVRLDVVSRHRTEPPTDGILLMADSCILGPGPHCHVVCRDWPHEVILYRHGEDLFCRVGGAKRAEMHEIEPLEIDGQLCKGQGRITRNSHIRGKGFSLSLEELAP